jgi:hypothetical protein
MQPCAYDPQHLPANDFDCYADADCISCEGLAMEGSWHCRDCLTDLIAECKCGGTGIDDGELGFEEPCSECSDLREELRCAK